MTDKQIIIYKKECYNEPYCSLNQVLEQLNAYKMEADEGKEINAELKAENDDLKKEINNKYSVSNFNVIFMREHIHNLKQTLAEIKEICNNNDELKGDFNLVDCDKYKLGKHNLANKILQKISEVEDE